jgi:hypothetical protein
MNFKEGFRRLALLTGCFGAICGSFGSYLELKGALQQKALHDRFERLATSDDVTKERKCRLLGYASGCSLDPNADIEDIAELPLKAPPNEVIPLKADPSHGTAKLSDIQPLDQDIALQREWSSMSHQQRQAALLRMGPEEVDRLYDALAAKYGGVDDPYANLPDTSVPHWTPPASELDGKEIKTIRWGEGKAYTVESIDTEDGNTIHATPLPSRWIYLWVVILPIAGFVIPWGLLRSAQWVAAGFVVNQESK